MPIRIKGKEYPIKATMWSLLQFKRDKGHQVSEMKDGDLEELLYYTWLCVRGACIQAVIEFDMNFEDYVTYVEGDPTEAMVKEKFDDEVKKKESH